MLATLPFLAAAGLQVAVACPGNGELIAALREAGVEPVAFDVRDTAGVRRSQAEIRQELAELLARRWPDLVHSNSLAMGRLAGPVVRDAGIPGIAHLRDIVRLSRATIDDLNANRRLLAVSSATRDYHIAAGVDPAKTKVLHNGVDLEAFRPRPPTGFLHRELGLAENAVLVGAIGQIGLRKGHDVLAQAALRLDQPDFADVHYLIVGRRCSNKEESRRFEADLQLAAARLPGRFHLLGVRDDVPQLLGELSLLVHPARQEPLGRVLLEAAACGVPVVATAVGGTREILPDDTMARLVPPDDPAALAEAIAELLRSPSLRELLGRAARRRAVESFSIATAAAGLVRHYQEILAAESAS